MNNDVNALFENNSKLVIFTLNKYFKHACTLDNYDDLFQIGSMGLFKACNNFDPSYNIAFSTYAVKMIWGEVKRYLRDDNIIRYPRRIINIANDIKKICIENNNYESSFISSEIDKLNITKSKKDEIMNYFLEVSSLDFKISSDSDKNETTFENVISNNYDFLNDIYYDQYINKLLEKLSDNNKEVLKLSLLGKTQMEISKILNISQAHVSRIKFNIKILLINEFILSEEYSIACECLFKEVSDKQFDIFQFCKKYSIYIDLIPQSILNKYNLTNCSNSEDKFVKKSYSNKMIKNLITRITIKLILQNKNISYINLKNEIINVIKEKNLYSYEINKFFNSFTNENIISLINRCEIIILKKYFTNENDVDINFEDVSNLPTKINIKFIKDNVIDILETLKRNKIMLITK